MNCPRCKTYISLPSDYCSNCGINLGIYKNPEKVEKRLETIIIIVFAIFLISSLINFLVLQKSHDFYLENNADYFSLTEIIKSLVLIPLALTLKNKPWKITALIIALVNIFCTIHWCFDVLW
ncbi:MAG: hypothetical protein H6Q25_1471 [Bacteroidetes bacterium]|nr:hypothetical protein [Bacteroidota bacterium]